MKKIYVIFTIIVGLLILFGYTKTKDNISSEDINLALSKISSITDIAIVTENNDPNGNLGKQGSYKSAIYFVDSNAPKIEGTGPIEKGTDGGGCVEIYSNNKDAEKRNKYLASFDGTLFASGSHKVLGTLVIRTSNKLKASQQQLLETKIINTLK